MSSFPVMNGPLQPAAAVEEERREQRQDEEEEEELIFCDSTSSSRSLHASEAPSPRSSRGGSHRPKLSSFRKRLSGKKKSGSSSSGKKSGISVSLRSLLKGRRRSSATTTTATTGGGDGTIVVTSTMDEGQLVWIGPDEEVEEGEEEPRDGASGAVENAEPGINVMEWLEQVCPSDVVPKIVAAAGPQTASTLSKLNRHWKQVMSNPGTWRVMCEDLYKWKPGDEEPESWFDLYRFSPCVPVDYSTVYKALQVASGCDGEVAASASSTGGSGLRGLRRQPPPAEQQDLQQERSLRILLRPGRYHLRQAVTVNAAPGTTIVFETVELPEPPAVPFTSIAASLASSSSPNGWGGISDGSFAGSAGAGSSDANASRSPYYYHPYEHYYFTAHDHQQHPLPSPPAPKRNRSRLFQLMRCHRPDAAVEDAYNDHSETFSATEDNNIFGGAGSGLLVPPFMRPRPKQATLVMRTRRHNEPAFHVRRGHVLMRNLDIQHSCNGLDIWNGNAAVQIQPLEPPAAAEDDDEQVEENDSSAADDERARPVFVEVEECRVTSRSGRGIVSIDGGTVSVMGSAVQDCAATGIYIGGPGSEATIHRTDVVRNGLGNWSHSIPRDLSRRHHHGIARGHSGIYLEQGHAEVVDCNVSQNTLTGISAVSPASAVLRLQDSDLIGNGTYQLEMPPAGTAARVRSSIHNHNNHFAVAGTYQPRSGLLLTDNSVVQHEHHHQHHHDDDLLHRDEEDDEDEDYDYEHQEQDHQVLVPQELEG